MKLDVDGDAFTLWLSPNDTQQWTLGFAPKGKVGRWPAAELGGRRIRATFDSSGLLECLVDGRDVTKSRIWVPVDEFSAMAADFIETKLPRDHAAWYVAVGQFKEGQA